MALRALREVSPGDYHRLMLTNGQEVLPYIYTPTVGQACQEYHTLGIKTRGLYVSLEDRYVWSHRWGTEWAVRRGLSLGPSSWQALTATVAIKTLKHLWQGADAAQLAASSWASVCVPVLRICGGGVCEQHRRYMDRQDRAGQGTRTTTTKFTRIFYLPWHTSAVHRVRQNICTSVWPGSVYCTVQLDTTSPTPQLPDANLTLPPQGPHPSQAAVVAAAACAGHRGHGRGTYLGWVMAACGLAFLWSCCHQGG